MSINNIEKSYQEQPEKSLLDEEDFRDFVEFREINSEDIKILESLSLFPKKLFVEFHNFFNLSKDKSLFLLDAQRQNIEPEKTERKEFIGLLYQFAEKYDWTTCWNMIRVFERRESKK